MLLFSRESLVQKYYTRRPTLAYRLAALSAIALIGSSSCAMAETDPFKPVTADDSCEFGFRVTVPRAWEYADANDPNGWVAFVLGKAVKYCKDGDRFMIIRGGDSIEGWIHDYYMVAALLCRRGDVKEEHPPDRRGDKQHQFSCTISKIASLKRKAAEGKPLFHYPEDWVDPRPGDVAAMRRIPGSAQPAQRATLSAKKGGTDACKNPMDPQYAERCGIPLTAPAASR
jgi:hypothetical protein